MPETSETNFGWAIHGTTHLEHRREPFRFRVRTLQEMKVS